MAEELELDRVKSRDLLKSLNLPVNPYEKIYGMLALREYLKTHEDQWIKINKLRGITETFHSPDYDLIESYLDDLEQKLGGRKETFLFLVEGAFKEEMVEVGIDLQVTDGMYPRIVMAGIEIKDCGYIGIVRPYEELPECMRIVTDKLADAFSKYGSRGSFSDEIRVPKTLESYMIDFTTRQPFPPSPMQWFMYGNIAMMYKEIAEGRVCDPMLRKEEEIYGVEVIITSDWAEDHLQAIRIPKEIRDNVFLKNYTMKEGKEDLYYVIPQPFELQEIGSVVESGKTRDEAIEKVKKVCEQIKGIKLHFNVEALDKAQGEIEKLEKFGINFFDKKAEYKEPEPKTEDPVIIPAKKEKRVNKFISALSR
jgi:hypothetical protein